MKCFRRTIGLLLVFFSLALPAFAQVTLPEELSRFPMYEGAQVQQSMNTGESVLAVLQLPQGSNLDAVINFYKDYFNKAGWTMAMEMRQVEGGALSFNKEAEQVMITIDFSDQQGIYSFIYTRNQ